MSQMRVEHRDVPQADVFRILLDSFPDMIHSVDDSGCIVYCNRAAEALLGYAHEQLIGKHIHEIYAEEVLTDVAEGFEALKTDGTLRVESLLKASDGERIPVEIRSFGIYNDDGEFIRTFSIVRDIRKVKELQNSLVHAGRLAAIGELASGVVHDIRNPLTVIMIANESAGRILKQAPLLDPENVDLLEGCTTSTVKAAGSIQRLVDHLRNFSRGIAEEQTRIDLFNIINDALFITSSRITSSGTTVEKDIKKGQVFVRGCRNQVEQIFVNLISNACDAMTGVKNALLTIAIEPTVSDAERKMWQITIADNGPGIPKEHIGNIFRAFYTTKEEGKGTGLGLSICRGIIADHGGDISVESTSEGTTFRVLLPQSEEDAE